MKKLLNVLLTFAIIFCLLLAPACGEDSSTASSQKNSGSQSFGRYSPVDKVVLFIGDGMGLNHVLNTELYTNSQTYFSGWETQISVDTNSLSGLTDSAAAATAMATGSRTQNKALGMLPDGTNLTSVTELAKKANLGAGVVTSDDITGATPAGFTAHVENRENSALILLSQTQNSLDFIIGEGAYSNYKSIFDQAGFSYINNYDSLNNDAGRFFACFNEVVCENGTSKTPTLTQLATFAVNYMEHNYPEGYFLMIEGAKIDKKSHNSGYRSIEAMMQELIDFNNAVKAVDGIISGDYALIVTADHETGGLLKAENKEQLTNALYTASDHTDTNVPLYFKSTLENVPEILQNQLILNTDIFKLCKYLLAI